MSTEPRYSVMVDWLVQEADKCTCGAGFAGYGHEPGCGYEPLVKMGDLKTGLAESGWELVELPKATPDFTGLEWKRPGTSWDVFAYGTTKRRGQVQVRTPEFITPTVARELGIALLAAAKAAEAVER